MLVSPIYAQGDPEATPIPFTDGLRLEFGRTVLGNINQIAQRDRYILFGRAGTVVSVGMFPLAQSQLVPRFEVYAPNGEVAVSSISAAGAVISGYELPVTGAYIIFARAGGGGRGGAYTMTAAQGIAVREVRQAEITANASVSGELLRLGDRDVYTIEVTAGADFAAEVVPIQSGLIPVLEIVDPNGNLLARAAGQLGNRRVLLTPQITQSGTYQVRVSGFQGQTVGAYLLRITAPESMG
ncbi:MAG: hypothetical protein KF726_23915 [Anaerolineae bacterium]|nr:hypothetical protein [Anaerolineae bacterium]